MVWVALLYVVGLFLVFFSGYLWKESSASRMESVVVGVLGLVALLYGSGIEVSGTEGKLKKYKNKIFEAGQKYHTVSCYQSEAEAEALVRKEGEDHSMAYLFEGSCPPERFVAVKDTAGDQVIERINPEPLVLNGVWFYPSHAFPKDTAINLGNTAGMRGNVPLQPLR